jgi:16S rRNA (cytidine1402-2'-O)-methyltransferase
MTATQPTTTVYLIPCWLEDQTLAPIPAYILDAVKTCNVFFVENERSARRYLKTLWKEMVIDQYEWHAIHKLEPETLDTFRAALTAGKTIGILSEAGCPGIADPGQLLIAIAHENGATVRPLVGPSSILLALMASGLNGQQFKFNGYLPVDSAARTAAIRNLETESARAGCTQIFIETPYRNNQLLAALLATCRPSTRLTIATNLTGPTEYIRTHPISRWRQLSPPPADPANSTDPAKSTDSANSSHLPDLHKQPTIFCFLA